MKRLLENGSTLAVDTKWTTDKSHWVVTIDDADAGRVEKVGPLRDPITHNGTVYTHAIVVAGKTYPLTSAQWKQLESECQPPITCEGTGMVGICRERTTYDFGQTDRYGMADDEYEAQVWLRGK